MLTPVGKAARRVLFVALAVGLAGPVLAKSRALTNADVQKMVAAKLAPDTIVMTIQSSPSKFDTSPDQLIRLSKAGVPQEVVQAMLAAGGGASGSSGGANSAVAVRAGEVVMVDGGKRVSMRYSAATTRTAVRALGFGGAATYAQLQGATAQLRTTNKHPSFEVAVPSNARPDGFVILASFASKKGVREVSIAGGGGFSFSTGIHPDRIIATTFTQKPSQIGAPSGYTLYAVSPNSDLATGEYAIVPAATAQQGQQAPFGNAAGPSGGNFFDFGVD